MSVLVLFACALGILSIGFLPSLPSLITLGLIPLALALALWLRHRLLWLLVSFVIGAGWGLLYGHWAVGQLLPPVLEGQDVMVEGRVIDLPGADSRRIRFALEVYAARNAKGELLAQFPRRIQLSWYDLQQQVNAGEDWRFKVRLKRPRSFVNPGGFDYQVWQMRRGVGASGYVRASPANERLTAEPARTLDHYRQHLRDWLLAHNQSSRAGLLLALLLGDRSLITADQWQQLQQTGTNHLVAISGLHVGFVGLLGWLIGGTFARLLALVRLPLPVSASSAFCSVLCAGIYSALAGFSLPTRRALIMLVVVQLAIFLRRSLRPFDAWCLALVLVLVSDPLAAYDAGFWLSFGAVAVLILVFMGRLPKPGRQLPGVSLVRAQWAIFVGLLLPLALLMQSVSLVAPVANILAIPLVTFVVVPGLLLAAVFSNWLPGASELGLWLADIGLQGLEVWLSALQQLAGPWASQPLVVNDRALCLASMAVLLLFLPRGLPGRWLAWPVLLLSLWVPVKARPPLQLTVLDVGQGLAVVVQTPDHALVYDAGPSYGENFDAGSGIVVPYLRRQGVKQLDMLVISHNDSDHAGGVPGLLSELTPGVIVYGEVGRLPELPDQAEAQSCHQQPPWQWNQVELRFLTLPGMESMGANDQSCVLQMTYAGHSLLLPGDISRSIESRLIASGKLPENVRLVIAPHHGSRTSSSPGFVRHLNPEWVIYSAGYRSQHGHPHRDVVARYDAQQTKAISTADSGALEFIWHSADTLEVREYRVRQKRYWH